MEIVAAEAEPGFILTAEDNEKCTFAAECLKLFSYLKGEHRYIQFWTLSLHFIGFNNSFTYESGNDIIRGVPVTPSSGVIQVGDSPHPEHEGISTNKVRMSCIIPTGPLGILTNQNTEISTNQNSPWERSNGDQCQLRHEQTLPHGQYHWL